MRRTVAVWQALPGAVYVLREGALFVEPLDGLLERLVAKYEISAEFNVIKFRTDELKVSFLSYPDFFTDAHPLDTNLSREEEPEFDPLILANKRQFQERQEPTLLRCRWSSGITMANIGRRKS